MTRLGDRAAQTSPLALLFMGLVADVLATVAVAIGFANVHQTQVAQRQQIAVIQQVARDAVAKADEEKALAAQQLANQAEHQRQATCSLVVAFTKTPFTTPQGRLAQSRLTTYGEAFGCTPTG